MLWIVLLACGTPPPREIVLPEPQEPHLPIRERFPDVSDADFALVGKPALMSPPWQQDRVDAVFVRATPDFRKCYEEEVARAEEFAAEVTLAFRVGEDGRVVERDLDDEPPFQRCIHERVARMQFEAWGLDQVYSFSYPLTFPLRAPPPAVATTRRSAPDGPTPDAQSIRDTVRQYSPQVKYCYEDRLRQNPSLEGRVEVSWTIDGGTVRSVDTVRNTTGDRELASCIADKTRYWKFGPQVAGEVQWPFVFRRGGPI